MVKMKVKLLIALFVWLISTPWTEVHQAPPLSLEFSRQEYWSELPFSSPGHLSDPGIDPRFQALKADSLLSEPPGMPLNGEDPLEKGILTLVFLPGKFHRQRCLAGLQSMGSQRVGQHKTD